MKNYTHEINSIIVSNDLKKWRLAQRLDIVPTYLSAQLRDGIKTDKARKAYYNTLHAMLDEKKKQIDRSQALISESLAEMANDEMAEKAE